MYNISTTLIMQSHILLKII